MKSVFLIFALSAFLLCGCAKSDVSEAFFPSEVEIALPRQKPAELPENPAPSSATPQSKPTALDYIPSLAANLSAELGLNALPPETAVRKAYKYMVENIYFSEPVGLDIWRYYSGGDKPVTYLQNRSISPFLFKIGSCEDFAAATVMLLEAAGFESRYVAGYTLSVDMAYVDHAWAMVKLNGQWYHLDPQLEQNVLKNNRLTYRYYLKSDDDMETDHKWGRGLIAYWDDITETEKEVILKQYTPPACLKSYPTPAAENAFKPHPPDKAQIDLKIENLKRESGKGDLPYLTLNVEPPVLSRAHHITPPLNSGQDSRLYEKANEILSALDITATDFDKVLFIHDYLAGNTAYDVEATGHNSGNAAGAIIDNIANCDGFAKAFEYLCGLAGINSLYISGTNAQGVPHAWNAVELNGLWYYVDVTWDRPLKAGDGVYHDYFLVSRDEIESAHIAGDNSVLVPSPAEQMDYYERMGYAVSSAENISQDFAKAIYRQLCDRSDYSRDPAPVFVEIKATLSYSDYLSVKTHYIKNIFNILSEVDLLARQNKSGFRVVPGTSVLCDFNDSTQVFTCYPVICKE